MKNSKSAMKKNLPLTSITVFSSLFLSACFPHKTLDPSFLSNEIIPKGHIIDQQLLALIPVGASRDQVILNLGNPSITSTLNDKVFYYISQTRRRPVAFMKPYIIDQKILAIYFDKNERVEKIANYGLKDSKVFDFITQTTPVGVQDMSFITHMLERAFLRPKPKTKTLPGVFPLNK